MAVSVVHAILMAWLGIGSSISVLDAGVLGRTSFVVVLLAGLFVLIVRGSSYARFATTTFLAPRIVRSAVMLGVKSIFGLTTWALILYILGVVMQVTIICLLWLRSSEAWFTAYDRSRKPTHGPHPTEPGSAQPYEGVVRPRLVPVARDGAEVPRRPPSLC